MSTLPQTAVGCQNSDIQCISPATTDIISQLPPSARYILLPAGSKAPRHRGWQRGGKPASAARRHLAAGGNVGLLCGQQSGWLIALDADARAGELEADWPVLRQTLRVWRADAPDRRKWLLRCVGAASAKCLAEALEILSGTPTAGSNAVIAGRHPDGCGLQFDGQLAEISLEQLSEIWRRRTAPTMPTAPDTAPTRNDIAVAVQTPLDTHSARYNAHTPIEGLLRLAGCRQLPGGNRWIAPQSTTQTASLLHNPDSNTVWAFSSRNPVGREGLLRPADWALALGLPLGAPTAPTRNDSAVAVPTPPTAQPEPPTETQNSCQLTPIVAIGAWLPLAYEVAARGDIAPHWRDAQRRLAEAYRHRATAALERAAADIADDAVRAALRSADYWLRQADAAARRAEGKTWPEAGLRRIMTAIVRLLEARGRPQTYVSGLELAAAANMSVDTVRRHLAALQPWFCTLVSRGERRAALLRLTIAYDNNVARISTVAVPTPPHPRNYCTDSRNEIIVSYPADAPLRAAVAHDAVATSWQPLAPTAANLAAVADTVERIRNGTAGADTDAAGQPLRQLSAEEAADADAWRQRIAAAYYYVAQCRLGADMAAIGGRGLLALQRLHEAGGRLSGAELADALGCSRSTLSRLVGRLVDAGCVTQPVSGQLALAADWLDNLDAAAALMPTIGMAAARHAAWLDSRIASLEARIEQAVRDGDAAPASAPRQLAILERATAALEETEAQRQAVDAYADGLPQPQQRRVKTRYASWDAQQAARRQARRQARQAERDRRDAAAEAAWRQALDAEAGITPALRQRADAWLAWQANQKQSTTIADDNGD